MLRHFCVLICLVCLTLGLSEARSESIVTEGFKQWASSGSSQALATWTRQSRIFNENKISQTAADLKKYEASLGSCTGFDILNTQNLTAKDTQVWAVAHFSYGSVFFRFLVFQDNVGQEFVNGLWSSPDPLEVCPAKFSGLGDGFPHRGS